MAVARVLGAKGLSGAVRVEPLTDLPERLAVGSVLLLDGETQERRVVSVEAGRRVPVLTLEGILDRDAANALVGRFLEVEAGPLPPGVYYWHQIVGLRVTDERGADLGRVVEVFRAGENEVYRVVGPGGELLLPATRDVVRGIDLERGLTVRFEAEEVR